MEYKEIDVLIHFVLRKESILMIEILGNNLKQFFDIVDNPPNDAEITYAGESYEVWEISDE